MRPGGFRLRDFLAQILDDILKTDSVARIGINQGLVGLEDGESLLLGRGPGDAGLLKGRWQ